MQEQSLQAKVHGALAGAAIGDALGALTEGWHYRAVREKWGRITGFVEDLGVHQKRTGKSFYTSTDDTQHLRVLAGCYIRKGRRIDVYDLADGILTDMDLLVMAETERELYKKICTGVPIREVGRGQYQTPTPCFSSPPIGIVNACDPHAAARDAYDLYSVWVSGLAQEAPMAVAAAIAEAFKPVATRESIVAAAQQYCGPTVREHLARAIEVASRFDDPYEAVPALYEEIAVDDGLHRMIEHQARMGQREDEPGPEQISVSGSPLEMVGIALASFHMGNGDATKAMLGAANFGRDCDGMASIAGAITGAWKGVGAITGELLRKVDEADRAYYGPRWDSIEALAEKLMTPVLATMREKEATTDALRQLTQSP